MVLLGQPLATLEEEHQHIGPGTGLDALASAAYGPEAALIPLGAAVLSVLAADPAITLGAGRFGMTTSLILPG